MKYSGVEWIGNVPDKWSLERLQWHLDEIKESNDPVKTTQVLSLTNKLGVIPYEEKGEQGNKAKENVNEYKVAYPNTIVANSMNILIGSVGKSDYFGCVSPVYYVFKPKKDENIDFLNYIFQSTQFQKELRKYANGILEIRLRVSSSDILKRYIAFPSKEEQQKIVDFLNKKTAEIDFLIEIENQQIEKLKEYKQAVITEAVTKGLDKNAAMKDSGVECLSFINANYRIAAIKFICDVVTDYVASGSFADLAANVNYLDQPDYAMLIRTIDVSEKGYKSQPVYIDKSSYDFLRNSNLFGGEIILPNIGASVGDVYIVPKLYERMSLAPNSIMIKTNQVDKYYYYYFASKPGRQSLIDLSQSAAQPKFNKTDFKALKVVNPSIEEQKRIVDYLDRKCVDIEKIITIKNKKINELTEYKKSLIYEYVTGKKEVC